MRAAAYDHIGPARDVLSLRELPTPQPGPGEVRVRLATSGINPSDVKTRAGTRTKVLPFPTIVPHSDGAGTIDAVGEGVSRSRIGERVWTWNAAFGRPMGTAAEYVTLPQAQAVPLPEGTDFGAAACLGIPALTAFHAVAMDGGVSGKTVLVAGGAGAVGHYAIQFAKQQGAAKILTTVSSAEKAKLARDAGADEVVDYKREDVLERVRALTKDRGVDRIVEIEFHGNAALDIAACAPEGQIVVVGSNVPEVPVAFVPSITKCLRMLFFMVYNLTPDDRRRAVDGVNAALAAGKLQHNVAVRLPLDRIVEGHELVESGRAQGNVVLDI